MIWNSTGRPLTGIESIDEKGNKSKKFDPAGQVARGALDSTVATATLVGRILQASGRTVRWGIRRLIAK